MFFDDPTASRVAPLIVCVDGVYRVHEPTLEWLATFKKPLCVIACVGKYRTGKSTLLNAFCNVAPSSSAGFAVGHSVQACTKGLWVFQEPVEDCAERSTIVIDTEGISSLDSDAGDSHDVRIFTLALLLSSAFLYNSMGPVDEAALQTLSLMTKISEFVHVSGCDEGGVTARDLSEHMPRFYWILRDFALRLETREHVACSPDDYLEEALRDPSASEERSRVRRVVREAFPRRTLVPLMRPASVDGRAGGGGNARFEQEVHGLRARILHEIAPVSADGHGVTGAMFAELCKHYCECLNRADARIPVVKDTWTLLAETQARDLMDRMLSDAHRSIDALERSAGADPLATLGELEKIVGGLCAKFGEGLMEPDPALAGRFEERVRELLAAARARVEALVEQQMEQTAQRVEALFAVPPDASLPARFAQELRAFESRVHYDRRFCDALRLRLWQRFCADWLPSLVQTQRDALAGATAEVERLRGEGDELRRDFGSREEWMRREAERQVEEARSKGETQRLTLRLEAEAAREQAEQLGAQLAELQQHVGELEARREREPKSEASGEGEGVGEEGEANGEGADAGEGVDDEADAARARAAEVERELRAANDEIQELQAIRTTLVAQNTQNRDARAAADCKWKEELAALQAKHESTIKRLRLTLEESERRALRDAQEARELEAAARRELSELRGACAISEAKLREQLTCAGRELRAQCEAQMSARATCEDLQERIVAMHRDTLDDIRKRDAQFRDAQRDHSRELIEAQVRRGEAQRAAERGAIELKEAKRRLEARDDAEKALKRLRADADEHRTTSLAEAERLRGRCDALVGDRESLRAEMMTLERKLGSAECELRTASAARNME